MDRSEGEEWDGRSDGEVVVAGEDDLTEVREGEMIYTTLHEVSGKGQYGQSGVIYVRLVIRGIPRNWRSTASTFLFVNIHNGGVVVMKRKCAAGAGDGEILSPPIPTSN